MSGQLTVTLTTLPGGEKILSVHAVIEEGKRKATGGCQLREREGHHLLRGEQHDCLRLPGLQRAQPSASRRKNLKGFSTPWRGVAWQVSAPGPKCEPVLHQTRAANVSHMFYCQYCITPSMQNIG